MFEASEVPPDAIVVRFGSTMDTWDAKALASAEDALLDPEAGRPFLSVFFGVRHPDEADDSGAIRRACEAAEMSHKRIRVARLADLPFVTVWSPEQQWHLDVDIVEATPERVADFLAAFGPPEENPTWRTFRSK